MGQQQLLLLVLATVIVGLATVAGIQAFEQGSVRANQDALTNTAVKIASDVQAKVKEPSQFGGYDGDSSKAKGSITLNEMGYNTNGSNEYVTSDGKCGFVSGGSNNPMSADSTDTSGFISVTCESSENEVTTNISSLNSAGISSNATALGN
jgi:hypothetical protein